MKIPIFSIACFLMAGLAGLAQEDLHPADVPSPAVFRSSWQAMRKKQPAGLQITFTLPKTHYHSGEVIRGQINLLNKTGRIYHVQVKESTLIGIGQDGSEVPNPLQWYHDHLMGMFASAAMEGNERYTEGEGVALDVNQWLQFPKPGVYHIYARTSVEPEARTSRAASAEAWPVLVSEPMTITIEPLSPEVEKAIIEQATKFLMQPHPLDDEAAMVAIDQLRYLQTPAAVDALLQFVDAPDSVAWEAMYGIYARPDYAAVAGKILAGVRDGKLAVSDHLVKLYQDLKNGENSEGYPEPVRPSLSENAARQQLLAAAGRVTAAGGTSDAFFAALVTAFRHNPHDPATRATLIARQLDLPQKQIDEILKKRIENTVTKPERLVDKDFLPLLRALVKPEKHDAYALAALATIAPEEARPIILEDLKRDHPIYVPTDYVGLGHDLLALEGLPEAARPSLDPILREKLAHPPADPTGWSLETVLLMVERYATPALVPDVVRLYHTGKAGLTGAAHEALLRYWVRADHASFLAELNRIAHEEGQPEITSFYSILAKGPDPAWIDEAMPFALASVKGTDLGRARWAAGLLEKHAGPEASDSIITVIERLAAQPLPKDETERGMLLGVPDEMIETLLRNRRWTLTPPQLRRLQKVATGKPTRDYLQRRIAGQPIPPWEQ